MKLSNNRFPYIYEMIQAVRLAPGVGRCLTKDQQLAQRSLICDQDSQAGASGIILPWYEENHGDRLESDQARFFARGRARRSAMTVTGTTSVSGDQGGMTVGNDVMEIGSALRDQLVLEQLGARVYGGLVGKAAFPGGTPTLSAQWLSENASGTDAGELFSSLSLEPHRITASVIVSDQLVMQGKAVEAHLRSELMAALAVEIQRTVIAGATNGPLGLLNASGLASVVGGADGAAPTYANVCDLEYAVTGTGKADRGNLGWLISPLGRKKLRNTPIFVPSSSNAVGANPVWRETEAAALLGHPAGVTTGIPDNLTKGVSTNCSAIIFGEMSELILGLWGSGVMFDAIRDATYGIQGKTLVTATVYADGGPRRPQAFAAMRDALCA